MLLFSAHVDAIIAPSEAMASRLREQGLETPVYTIPNSASRHAPTGRGQADVRAWLNAYPRDSYVRLLYVGRISPEKRVDKVVEALARVAYAAPVIFLVVGDGIDEPRVRRMVLRLGLTDRVLFAGEREESFVSAAMETADLLVLPSYRFDTQPLTVVEAAVGHLPVLYCDDLLKEGLCSGNALQVKPTAHGLSQGILALALDPGRLKQMAYLAGEASEEFAVEAVATKTVEVYRQAIKNKRRSRACAESERL
jgi:1,2-diacylglycerol 3-alpha-glucosyltransferase